MSRKTTSGEAGTEAGGEHTPTTQSAPPKRKFEVSVGTMTFTKRCSVTDMQDALDTTQGTHAVLLLDGYRFDMQPDRS